MLKKIHEGVCIPVTIHDILQLKKTTHEDAPKSPLSLRLECKLLKGQHIFCVSNAINI